MPLSGRGGARATLDRKRSIPPPRVRSSGGLSVRRAAQMLANRNGVRNHLANRFPNPVSALVTFARPELLPPCGVGDLLQRRHPIAPNGEDVGERR